MVSLLLGFATAAFVLAGLRERNDAMTAVEDRIARVADLTTRQLDQTLHHLRRLADIAADSIESTWSAADVAALETMALLGALAEAVPGVVDIAV
ncbi:MAG: hypothetical protein FJX57_10850, partial [Alphaproteobacteria bacterium]|nr:hypothetical protein [Alphaproteobacteria bacterium]